MAIEDEKWTLRSEVEELWLLAEEQRRRLDEAIRQTEELRHRVEREVLQRAQQLSN